MSDDYTRARDEARYSELFSIANNREIEIGELKVSNERLRYTTVAQDEILHTQEEKLLAQSEIINLMEEALKNLRQASIGLYCSYDDVIECRGDEDCDHCFLQASDNYAHEALTALKEFRETQGVVEESK